MSETRVAVVIPCYNQAAYLGEAISSALNQSVVPDEVIVIDDGSTDHTRVVAESFERVRCISQENRGSAGARNTGLQVCTSDFVVFLDADDRLLPNAIEAGVRELERRPECAFVFGRYRYLSTDGTARTPVSVRDVSDPYAAFLRGNFVVMQAAVMYRRSAIEQAGRFDAALKSCEDYDLYLRVAREWPIAQHEEVVAEYRRHDANKSSDPGRVLRYASMALAKQRPFVRDDRALRLAHADGVRAWRYWFLNQLAARVKRDGWVSVPRQSLLALRRARLTVVRYVAELALRRLRRRKT